MVSEPASDNPDNRPLDRAQTREWRCQNFRRIISLPKEITNLVHAEALAVMARSGDACRSKREGGCFKPECVLLLLKFHLPSLVIEDHRTELSQNVLTDENIDTWEHHGLHEGF